MEKFGSCAVDFDGAASEFLGVGAVDGDVDDGEHCYCFCGAVSDRGFRGVSGRTAAVCA